MKTLDRSLWTLAGLVLFLSFGFTEMMGSDMWWHLAAGRELLQTGTPWMVDDWSYTAHGKDWLNHEWLADIVYYSWATLWNVESLVYWKWLVILLTFGVLQHVLARESDSQFAGLACAVMAVAIAAPFIDVRPHIYSLLNYSLLLLLLLRRSAPAWVLALLFVIWVNLHGGFFFGLMALGILLFPWRDLDAANIRRALLLGLLCVAASALNPSGLKNFLYPLTYAFDASSPYRQLGEWLSPFLAGGIRSPAFFFFLWTPLLAVTYLLPQVRRETGVPWEGLALTALTLAMALSSRRFIPLFGISLAVMLAPLLGYCCRRLKMNKFSPALAVAALLVGVLRLMPYPLTSGPAFHYLVAEYTYPIDMLNFIEANQLQGRVYALYNWGGYIHWRTDGRLKVFIDGRADTLYDDGTYRHFVGVLQETGGWEQTVESTGAEYFLWPNTSHGGREKLARLLATGKWVPVYRDATGFLLARKHVRLPTELKASESGPYRDLASAQNYVRAKEWDKATSFFDKVREAVPYQLHACNSLAAIYRSIGQAERAEEILTDCRSWFPSRDLR